VELVSDLLQMLDRHQHALPVVAEQQLPAGPFDIAVLPSQEPPTSGCCRSTRCKYASGSPWEL